MNAFTGAMDDMVENISQYDPHAISNYYLEKYSAETVIKKTIGFYKDVLEK